jgi:hypothetical protein
LKNIKNFTLGFYTLEEYIIEHVQKVFRIFS